MKNNIKTISRKEVSKAEDIYADVLKKESHHNHELIMDEGVCRWRQNPDVRFLVDEKISLNDLIPLLHCLGYDKNSEVYRKLYRDLGYSLYGYWEVFYWEVNNPKASEYIPNKDCTGKNNS